MKPSYKRIITRARCALLAFGLAAAPALAAEMGVTQKNKTFSVPAITLHAGDTLHFHNDDTVTHNITVRAQGDDDEADDLGLQKPGQVVSHTFSARGDYRVVCSIHPHMRLLVKVQ